MSALKTPEDRYRNEPAFHSMVDAMVTLALENGWTAKDFLDCMTLAEELAFAERLRRLRAGPTPSMRVYQRNDGFWYWQRTDSHGDGIGDRVGPFVTAIEAGRSARDKIIEMHETSSKGG